MISVDPHIVGEETDLRDPHIVCEKTDLRGPHLVRDKTDLREAPKKYAVKLI